MRGADREQIAAFSYIRPEDRIPKTHPLRSIKKMADGILKGLSCDFDEMYSPEGRRSIAPEQLLRALLLQALYTVRSERMLMEQIEYNLLFRWFVGLEMDDEVWVPTTFTKNRDRLLKADIANKFFLAVVGYANEKGLLSDEHFTVDGTLIEAWASLKSFQPKEQPAEGGEHEAPSGRNSDVDFRGEKRSNETHQSTTDPEARLYRKGPGKEAKLCYAGHAMMENRNGLVVGATLTQATGKAEREAAMELICNVPGFEEITLGADKGYDVAEFVEGLRELNVVPHVASKSRSSAIDEQATRDPGYVISQVIRKRIEEIFGWVKTIAGLAKTKHRGVKRVGWMFIFDLAIYNLLRMSNLLKPA